MKKHLNVTDKSGLEVVRARAKEALEILSTINIRIANGENVRKFAPQVVKAFEKLGVTPEQVMEYYNELGASAAVMRRYADLDNIWVFKDNMDKNPHIKTLRICEFLAGS